MKTITMYELLGLVKDGKAPKKIKIDNDILTLSKTNIIQYNFGQCGQLNWDYYIENYKLDEKVVEILDKTEEKKIPKKFKIEQDTSSDNCYLINENGTKYYVSKINKTIIETLNQLIDYLESKGE